MKGFKTFVAEDIPLESNQTKRVDVALQVGETGTEVTVSGAAPVIERKKARSEQSSATGNTKISPCPAMRIHRPSRCW